MTDQEWLEACGEVLNAEQGMEYCGFQVDLYRAVIGQYVESDQREALIRAFTEEDWETYIVLAHGVKSTSLTIGANDLSDLAKSMEFAGKEGRMLYIMEKHGSFLAAYGKLLEDLKKLIEV